MAFARKIINDPVYGFITIDHPLLLSIISHPWYQRLRRIHQMAFAHLVYPGAVHSRLHHSLGAYHLMSCALNELKNKKSILINNLNKTFFYKTINYKKFKNNKNFNLLFFYFYCFYFYEIYNV